MVLCLALDYDLNFCLPRCIYKSDLSLVQDEILMNRIGMPHYLEFNHGRPTNYLKIEADITKLKEDPLNSEI